MLFFIPKKFRFTRNMLLFTYFIPVKFKLIRRTFRDTIIILSKKIK